MCFLVRFGLLLYIRVLKKELEIEEMREREGRKESMLQLAFRAAYAPQKKLWTLDRQRSGLLICLI